MSTTASPTEAPGTHTDARQPVVEFKHVSIGFDGNSVLNNISFTARPGEMIILIGAAGTGKSLLLKLANGLIRPDSGHIRVFDKTDRKDDTFPSAAFVFNPEANEYTCPGKKKLKKYWRNMSKERSASARMALSATSPGKRIVQHVN